MAELSYHIEGPVDERPGQFWKPGGYGYTDRLDEAGKFSADELSRLNIEGCVLHAADASKFNKKAGWEVCRFVTKSVTQ